jgi:hypothetical protein
MKPLFSWFGVEKLIPQFAVKTSLLKSIQSVNRMFSWIQHESLWRLLSAINTSVSGTSLFSFIESVFSRTGNIGMVKPQMRRVGNNLASASAGNYSPVQSMFEYKSSAILPQVNLLADNSETPKFWMRLNKPFTRNIESNPSNSMTVLKRTIFNNKVKEDFYFHKRQNIEQEVEEIKKIIVETKEAVVEKSPSVNFPSEMDIKRHLDINRISDQVYQNIERRIRMEKERRGL